MAAGAGLALPAGVIVFERGWLSSNNILLHGTHGTALVDSGYSTHASQTLALLRGHLHDRPLDLLLNTHLHSDHCGGNALLQREFPSLRTLIPPGQAEHVRKWDPVALTYVPTGQVCERFSITGVLQPGTTLALGQAHWQVHAAPGHDPHSVVLFDPDSRTLISADALWQDGFGVVFQELEGESAFDEVAATLQLIEELAPRVVIPGHGQVFTDVSEALERAGARLAYYRAQPAKHALHAAKVLLKFKLLEWQRIRLEALRQWALATPYFQLVHARWGPSMPPTAWIDELVESLVRSGAARRDADHLMNA